MYKGMSIYRALVVASSSSSGDIYVKIPSVLGNNESISISKIGRSADNLNVWAVPNVGAQVLVAVEDERFSNVYIVSSSLYDWGNQ